MNRGYTQSQEYWAGQRQQAREQIESLSAISRPLNLNAEQLIKFNRALLDANRSALDFDQRLADIAHDNDVQQLANSIGVVAQMSKEAQKSLAEANKQLEATRAKEESDY